MPRNREAPFKAEHRLKYGLKITERSAATKDVVTVACRFCVHFPREEKVGAKRKATENVKYFQLFRTDAYRQHLTQQHPTKWQEYCELTDEGKTAFWARESHNVPHRNTVRSHFGEVQIPIRMYVKKPIVDDIIGELFFNNELEMEDIEEAKQKALAIFKELEEEDPDASEHVGEYVIIVKNPAQFRLIASYLSAGLSFRQAATVLTMTKEHTGLASLGSIDRGGVTKYARYICALNLQTLQDILERVWTFSIAMDLSTHMTVTYLDVRIRVDWHDDIMNFHLLSIPMFTAHTAQEIYNHAIKLLDVIFPDWKRMIIAITTDGERKMTGRVQGVATLFETAALPGFIRIWCGLHQLDLQMHIFYDGLMGGHFVSTLTPLISYLRRQQNLINDMRTRAPLLADTRWESMNGVARWFNNNRVAILGYLNEKNPVCKPPSHWWIVLTVVESVASEASAVFTGLQGLSILVAQQREAILKLQAAFQDVFGVEGPLTGVQADRAVVDRAVLSDDRLYSLALESVETFFENTTSFEQERLRETSPGTVLAMTNDIANNVVNLVANISRVVAERDSSNQAAAELPPVLPKQLKANDFKATDFAAIVQTHSARLACRWRASAGGNILDTLEREFRDFKQTCHREAELQAAIEATSANATFAEAWNPTQNRWPNLKRFCGGIATAFPGTATVESDFSIVKWEKDVHRASLTDFSLEGVMHARQFKQLQVVSFT